MAEEPRDYLAEARRIVAAESMMWPQHEHLKALHAALTAANDAAETERLRLAACSTAAVQNTASTRAQRLKGDHPYFSAAYGDVCAAVDREITHRQAAAQLRATLQRVIDCIDVGHDIALRSFEDVNDARTLLANGPPTDEAIASAAATSARSFVAALSLAVDHDAVTAADLEAIDAQIDLDMVAMGRSLKIMARRLLGLRINVPRSPIQQMQDHVADMGRYAVGFSTFVNASAGDVMTGLVAAQNLMPADRPPVLVTTAPTKQSPGDAAGLDMVVIIERHGFRTDPYWVWFRLAELPTPGSRPEPVVEGEDMFCAGQFSTLEIARAAVDAIRGIAIKEIIVRQ